jgi:tRNA A-37 threonylcarbamoyl transferase component Bud32
MSSQDYITDWLYQLEIARDVAFGCGIAFAAAALLMQQWVRWRLRTDHNSDSVAKFFLLPIYEATLWLDMLGCTVGLIISQISLENYARHLSELSVLIYVLTPITLIMTRNMPRTPCRMCIRLFVCISVSATLVLLPLVFEEGSTTQAYFILVVALLVVITLFALFFIKNDRMRTAWTHLHLTLTIIYMLLICVRMLYVVIPDTSPDLPSYARGLPVIVARTYFLILVMASSIGVLYGDSRHWRTLYMSRDLLSSLVASLARSSNRVLDDEVLDFSNIMIEYGRLVFSRRVGSGANAIVYKGRYKEPGHPGKRVALKVYTPTDISVDVIKRWLREVSVAAILRHPNVISCHGISIAPPTFVVVMEYCPYTLLQYVQADERPFDELLGLMLDVASAVAYLHRKMLIHRDIKSSNIMVSNSETHSVVRPVAKLIDFGESRQVSTRPMTLTGTPQYIAPEMLARPIENEFGDILAEYDQKVDVFSMAIVFWEMLHRGRPMFPAHWSANAVMVAVVGGFRPPVAGDIAARHAALVSFIRTMWAEDPKRRPSASRVVAFLDELHMHTNSDDSA